MASNEAFAAGYWTDARVMARRAVERMEGQQQRISSCSGAEISLWMSGWVDAVQKSPFVCGASEMGEWEGAVLKGCFPAVGLSTAHLAGCRDRAALPTVMLRARDGCRLAGRCESQHCQVYEMPIH